MCGWIEGKREDLLLGGGNGVRGNFDDLERGHGKTGGGRKE